MFLQLQKVFCDVLSMCLPKKINLCKEQNLKKQNDGPLRKLYLFYFTSLDNFSVLFWISLLLLGQATRIFWLAHKFPCGKLRMECSGLRKACPQVMVSPVSASGHRCWELPGQLHLLKSDISMGLCVQPVRSKWFLNKSIWLIQNNLIPIELNFSLIHK